MRNRFVYLGLLAAIASAPAVVVAAPSLRGTMHAWRAEAGRLHAQVWGRTMDAGVVRGALQRYAGDAGRIAGQTRGSGGQARNFKRRMVAFQADAQTALGDLGRRPALKADVSRLMADCQACHNSFN